MANLVPRLTTGDVGRGVRPQAQLAATEARDLSGRILQLQRTVGNRGVQQWLDSSTRRPTRRALQREPADDEEFEPCPSWEWGSSFHFFGSRPGGPYQDQGIAIQYDKIAPLPDPVQAGDPRAQAEVFNTPAMLEQLYHDATVSLGVPESQPQKRRRALWFVCIVEDSAGRVGVREARELYKIGCLTVLNCGMDWGRVFAHFSETTASGRRVRGLILKSFINQCAEFDFNLAVASNALMLLGALGVASSPVRPGGSTGAHAEPPKTTTLEPAKTPTPGEPTKPPVAVDPPKTPTLGEPTKPPLKVAPPDTASTWSPADARKYLEQHGLTSKEVKGLAGERISQPRAALIERLAKHFTDKDLKALGGFLAENPQALSESAVDDLIAHLEPGEMTDWVRQAQIADVHGQATRLPNEHREGSLQDDPKARAGVTTKPSPGPEPRQFRSGNFAHKFAEYLVGEDRLPRPNQAEVRIELSDGTGDIIRTDRITSGQDEGRLYEIKPAGGRAAQKGRAELPGRLEALQRKFPKKNGWKGDVVEYTRADVEAWLTKEADAARAAGRPIPDVDQIMKLFGF